jgi:5-methylcytosine-specific restriction endonuclease McrA
MLKKCNGCLQEKSPDEFHHSSMGKLGRVGRCKMCVHLVYLQNREKNVARARAWKIANPLRYKQLMGKHRDANREKLRHRSRLWAIAHRQLVAKRARDRRIFINSCGASELLTSAQWYMLLDIFQYRCAYCRDAFDGSNPRKQVTQDHKIPLTRGGLHTMANVVPACRACNSRKHAKTVEEFLGDESASFFDNPAAYLSVVPDPVLSAE